MLTPQEYAAYSRFSSAGSAMRNTNDINIVHLKFCSAAADHLDIGWSISSYVLHEWLKPEVYPPSVHSICRYSLS